MSDAIDRQEAIDVVSKWLYDVFGIKESDGTATIFKRLKELPSAQLERKTGKWMPVTDESRKWHYCSECHYQQYEKTKFCPSCGADMRGEENG